MEKKSRKVGTVSRGIRCPIIREGDDLAGIVTASVLEAARDEGFALRDRDVIAITESVVARSQGNYASVDDISVADNGYATCNHCGLSYNLNAHGIIAYKSDTEKENAAKSDLRGLYRYRIQFNGTIVSVYN